MVGVNYQLSRVWDRPGDVPLYLLVWGIILLALIEREEGPPVVGTIPTRNVGLGKSICLSLLLGCRCHAACPL